MKQSTHVALILGAALCYGCAVADDLTVVSSVTTDGRPTGTDTTFLTSDHIRTSHSLGTDLIIDLKSGTMTTLDERKKTYYVVTRQDLATMQARMAERMNDPKIKQAMAMMKGMSENMASSAEVKRTGVTRKVAGFSCEEWSISMSAMMSIKECVTNDFKYPAESWAALAEFSESMRKSMSGFGQSAKAGEDFAEKIKSIKGFPVATVTTFDAGVTKSVTTTEVTEVRHSAIPASTWEVPAGFSQMENPMMKAFDRHER